jgi:hypothetical protein
VTKIVRGEGAEEEQISGAYGKEYKAAWHKLPINFLMLYDAFLKPFNNKLTPIVFSNFYWVCN